MRSELKKKYLSDPDYVFEKVDRASKACGPLVKWAIAQINYADMLLSVDPLRNELKSLEEEAEKTRKKVRPSARTIAEVHAEETVFFLKGNRSRFND